MQLLPWLPGSRYEVKLEEMQEYRDDQRDESGTSVEENMADEELKTAARLLFGENLDRGQRVCATNAGTVQVAPNALGNYRSKHDYSPQSPTMQPQTTIQRVQKVCVRQGKVMSSNKIVQQMSSEDWLLDS